MDNDWGLQFGDQISVSSLYSAAQLLMVFTAES